MEPARLAPTQGRARPGLALGGAGSLSRAGTVSTTASSGGRPWAQEAGACLVVGSVQEKTAGLSRAAGGDGLRTGFTYEVSSPQTPGRRPSRLTNDP